jgi:transposase
MTLITQRDAVEHVLGLMREGKFIYREGKVFRMWDGRNGGVWLSEPKEVNRMSRGYKSLSIKLNGKTFTILLHRLIWEYFNGPIPEGLQINHIDGNKLNNLLENLELVTPSQNTQHAHDMGLAQPKRGEENGYAKLTNEQVEELRKLAEAGISFRKLGKMFGVSDGYAGQIAKRERRLGIGETPNRPTGIKGYRGSTNKSAKLTEEQVIEIKRMLKQGIKSSEIAKRFNVSFQLISRIKLGKNWGWLQNVD